MRTMKNVVALAPSILLLLLTVSPHPSFSQSKQQASRKYITLEVQGLACPFCAYGLEKKLKSLEGAENFQVDFEKGVTTLDIPASTKITEDQLKQIVTDAGFELKKVEISDKPAEKTKDNEKQSSG